MTREPEGGNTSIFDLWDEIAKLNAENARLLEALKDATAHLAGLVSSYETYVGRIDHRGMKDPFYKTRIKDYQDARDRAHDALVAVMSTKDNMDDT